MAAIGTIIDNKYEILTEIGRGGMSVVYLAMDRRLNKQWAVKEIKKQVNDRNNEVIVQSLIAEANLIKKLDHPALPRIVDIIDNGITIYVVMDYIEGKSLDIYIQEFGAQEQEQVIDWAKQLCEALTYLHSRTPPIIYRDMKPANIMLKPEGALKLIDFGIAREYKEQNIADTISLGTKGYAAPEQFGGQGQTDARTDIYSLGVTLYHLVTGKSPTEPPYEIYPVRYWNPNLSSGLEKIIQKCVQLNPDDRYQNCQELLYDLEHYNEIDDAFRKKQKNKLIWFAVTAGMSLILLCAGFIFRILAARTNTANYETAIEQAEKTVDYQEKIDTYLKAVNYDAGRTEAYSGLIAAFKRNDGLFTIEEEEKLITQIKKNMDFIKQNPERYIELCYEVGKIYWFYYDYGNAEDNQLTRVKSAVPWFSDAIMFSEENQVDFIYLNMARIYRDIGIFHRDYSLNIQEASGKGTYSDYWNNLNSLLEFVEQNPDEDELVLWEAYKVIVYSLENYMQKFKSDGITRKQIEELCKRLLADTERLAASDDKTLEMKEYILRGVQENGNVYLKINSIYQDASK